MTYTDAVLALCTLLGPVFAVQAQKWVERSREAQRRKLAVFEDLMTTRGDLLSFQHKRALNMIDFAFHNNWTVINAWHNYFDHLKTWPELEEGQAQPSEEAKKLHFKERERLFYSMLKHMAVAVNFELDDRTLERGFYSPIAHAELEGDNLKIRKGLIGLLGGEQPLKMDVVRFALDPTAVAAQVDLQQKLASTIESGAMRVTVGKATASDGASA
jgi:hypothetical protein